MGFPLKTTVKALCPVHVCMCEKQKNPDRARTRQTESQRAVHYSEEQNYFKSNITDPIFFFSSLYHFLSRPLALITAPCFSTFFPLLFISFHLRNQYKVGNGNKLMLRSETCFDWQTPVVLEWEWPGFGREGHCWWAGLQVLLLNHLSIVCDDGRERVVYCKGLLASLLRREGGIKVGGRGKVKGWMGDVIQWGERGNCCIS